MFFSELSFKFILFIMKLSFIFFSGEFCILSIASLFKRITNRKKRTLLTKGLELKMTQLYGSFFSLLSVSVLYLLYNNYFGDLDGILSSLLVMGGLIAFNIILKIISVLVKFENDILNFTFSLFLKSMDNFLMLIIFTLTTAILASQITTVDISRYFGVDIKRSTLINLPFLISIIFLLISNIGLLLASFLIKKNIKKQIYFRDSYFVFSFTLVSLILTLSFKLPYNIFLIICIGIISSYLINKISFYMNKKEFKIKKNDSNNLRLLYPFNNIISCSFYHILVLGSLLLISIKFGKFYGLGIIGLAMFSPSFFMMFDNEDLKSSETYKYIAKAVNNIVLFYILFETLEFVLKERININIFSMNIVLGFILSFIIILFNMSKMLNLIKYMQKNHKSFYLFFRSVIYISIFLMMIYILYPFIDYEILSSFALGMIFSTLLISLISVNGIDFFENKKNNYKELLSILKNSLIPILNHITTLFIILIILFITYY